MWGPGGEKNWGARCDVKLPESIKKLKKKKEIDAGVESAVSQWATRWRDSPIPSSITDK